MVPIVTSILALIALAGIAPAAAAGSAPPAPAEAAPPGLPAWGTERVPQAGSGRSELRDVSVLSADEAWAVGNSGYKSDETAAPLVERWDGSRWSVVAGPELTGAILNGVVAVASDDVWMVGAFNTSREALILHWDGTSIERVEHPNPGGNRNDLYDVSASGPDDVWAIGDKTTGVSDPLALRWDGTEWREVAVPKTTNYDQLFGVTAIAPDDAWAVGEFAYEAAAVHWDGRAWTRVDPPIDGSSTLTAVSAAAADEVWAVGQDGDGTLSARWDGTRWRLVDVPDSDGFLRDDLAGVAALAVDDVWAVGSSYAEDSLALHWDGNEWNQVAVPNPPESYDQLRAVAGTPDGELLAAGGLDRQAYVLRLEDGAFDKVRVEQVGTSSNQLLGISAAVSDDIWAVGALGQFNPKALTLHYNGDRWRRVKAPAPPEGTQLNDVVSIAADDAWAVGQTNPGDFGKAVALHWDGERWRRVRVPQSGNQYASPRLLAVDAIGPDDVWAVGAYDVGSFPETVLLHWNGTRWRLADSSGCMSTGGLSGVTFIAPDDGWAVGQASICHWNGRRWTLVPSPQPRGNYFEINYPYQDVSGAASDDVWAVGTVVFDFGQYVDFGSFAVHWDGSAWQRVDNPSGVGINGVEAITTNDVWAVGRDSFGPLIVHWNGGSWTDVPTPDREDGVELEGITRAGSELWDAGRSLAADDGFRSLVQRAPSPSEGAVLGSSNVGNATVSWTGPEGGVIETEPTGDFQVGGLPAGRYRFTLAHEGCIPITEVVDVVAGRTKSFEIIADCTA